MAQQKPDWLPDIVSVNGVWEIVVRRLYQIFETDFIRAGCHFEGLPVWWDRRKQGGDTYEEGFWHLITRTDSCTKDRLIDPRRAERLPWCKPVIENSHDVRIRLWDYRESNNKIRTYIWLERWDYVVVLEKRSRNRGPIAFLVTAYHVDGESTRRRLRRKYENREP